MVLEGEDNGVRRRLEGAFSDGLNHLLPGRKRGFRGAPQKLGPPKGAVAAQKGSLGHPLGFGVVLKEVWVLKSGPLWVLWGQGSFGGAFG